MFSGAPYMVLARHINTCVSSLLVREGGKIKAGLSLLPYQVWFDNIWCPDSPIVQAGASDRIKS